MTNQEIAKSFQLLGKLMELHGENPFKIRSYENAYMTLRKLEEPLVAMSDDAIADIKGVGKAISGKIRELLDSGKMATLEKYKSLTPQGIQEMLQIKGFGPKKIRVIWKELGVETIGELLYAVNENRLIELKGFGKKTQDDLREKLEYYQKSKDKFHYATLEKEAQEMLRQVRRMFPGVPAGLTGEIRRCCNVVSRIELLVGRQGDLRPVLEQEGWKVIDQFSPGSVRATVHDIAVTLYQCQPSEFGSKLFRHSASPGFLEAFLKKYPGIDFKGLEEEQAVFQKVGLPFIEPELREDVRALELAGQNRLPRLILDSDILGVVHAHTTYSDGLHTIREMAEYARVSGYQYLTITDHSRSAFYANGLSPERVLEQMAEIDALNQELAPFVLFKGIESDILADGSLDYEEDLLKQFDLVIASIHSNLRMDEAKATQRLLTAVENPYTSILGHPTGRLLLSRTGYPIDHKKVIDACAANEVAIEINANPYRLDLDWTWIPYAMEKGVLISVNPDAHSKEGIRDIHYGVCSARKGGLTRQACLNALDAAGFLKIVRKGR